MKMSWTHQKIVVPKESTPACTVFTRCLVTSKHKTHPKQVSCIRSHCNDNNCMSCTRHAPQVLALNQFWGKKWVLTTWVNTVDCVLCATCSPCQSVMCCLSLQVVCRQLDLLGGVAHGRSHHGQGSGQIWLKDIQCAGTEASLAQCRGGVSTGSQINSCFHYEDSSVTCEGARTRLRLLFRIARTHANFGNKTDVILWSCQTFV